MSATVRTVAMEPYEGQKPGTSGLRKRVKVFQQPNYTEAFIQATLDSAPREGACKGATLAVGGDGRYFMDETIQKIIRISAANGVKRLVIGQNGIMSTPAVSNLIRHRKLDGGIILTASHNPGGPENDFGIKFNLKNGGPAPESVTNAIYEKTRAMTHYSIADMPKIDVSQKGLTVHSGLEIEVVDSVDEYVELLKSIFDFDLIKKFFKMNPHFKVLFDGLNGVTGPYGKRIFVDELGLPITSVDQYKPLPDFGGGHPDPNLTYAHKLVERVENEDIDFGAASDGDGDRNMIISHDWFVTPSDSVAVIADWGHVIPYFKKNGIHGLARSMPTSAAIDRVAEAKKLECFEVPTGWKFFGNLMDAGRLSICGEESFGTGSDHIREKDGIWAIVAWLNILAAANAQEQAEHPGASIVTIHTLMRRHYKAYGRNYFTRYDFEEVDAKAAGQLMDELRDACVGCPHADKFIGKTFDGFKVKHMDDFEYHDPIDHSVAKKQGVRILFEDGSRIVFRLSGTGSHGATIRLYIEKYEPNPEKWEMDAQVALKPLIHVALELSQLKKHTGRENPTVIT